MKRTLLALALLSAFPVYAQGTKISALPSGAPAQSNDAIAIARSGSNFRISVANILAGNAATASALASNPADCSSNQFANAIAANGDLTCAALTLAGAQFANQGTTTTVLHGNASGNPSWGAVSLSADVSGDLPYANLTPSANASRLLGRQSGSAGDWGEITLGTNLSMSGSTLNASGGGSGCSTAGSAGQLLTDDGAGGCDSNANLTYDGTDLTVTGGSIIADNIIESGTLTDEGICTYESTGPLMDCSLVPGTGVAAALAINVGSAGAPVLFNGALGTPSSGTVTNLTGTASININGTVGATTPAAGTFTTLVAGSTTSLLVGTAGSAVGNIGFRNATSGTATLGPPTGALGTYTVTLPNAASTLPIFGQQITFAGPTQARTVTLPDASFTVARTDAANTFTGTQTITQIDMGNTDTSITRSGAGIIAIEGVVSTRTIFQGTATINPGAITSGTCSSAITTAATGVVTTDTIDVTLNADPTSTTGYNPSGDLVYLWAYPTADNINIKVCNKSGSSVTPGSRTANIAVRR